LYSLQIDSGRIQAYLPDFYAFRVHSSSESDDYALDMEEFGNIVKRMLRIYHMRITNSSNDCIKCEEEEDKKEDKKEDSNKE
jgi:hypothetical protein